MANIKRSRRSGFTLRGGRMRRESFWIAIAETSTTLASGTPVLFTGLTTAQLALRPFTVVRTRGLLQLSSDQLTTTESYFGAYGMAVVSDQAFAIGITAVPTPITDKDSDLWFVFEELTGRFAVSSAIGILEVGNRREFDSRAMRKVEDGQDIAIVEENSGSPFAGAIMTKSGRMLIKLH